MSVERHQHLAGGDLVLAERLGPGARQRDLADRRGGLAVLELERPFRQLEHGAAERDRAGRNDDDVALVLVQLGDVLRQRGEPRLFEPAGRRSTSSDEPTFTTMRRKSARTGALVAADIGGAEWVA